MMELIVIIQHLNPPRRLSLPDESLIDIDCNRIVKEIAGRGGGKPYFATGMIKVNEASNIVGNIVTLVKNKL